MRTILKRTPQLRLDVHHSEEIAVHQLAQPQFRQNIRLGGKLHCGARVRRPTRGAWISAHNRSRTAYTFSNGVPTQITMYGDNEASRSFHAGFGSAYAQDPWTVGRLTVQGGLRVEHIGSYFPAQQMTTSAAHHQAWDRHEPTPNRIRREEEFFERHGTEDRF